MAERPARIPSVPSTEGENDRAADDTGRLWFPYAPLEGTPTPLIAERTWGARIRLSDGRELIDGVSSWWTACHGYNHPAIAAAVTAQLERMPHVMFGGLAHAPAIELADRLCAILPGAPERVFLCDSGSVAVEIAMKMAVQYWLNRGERGRTRFVSFGNAYHGDTMAAMSVSDPEEGMHRMFKGVLPEQIMLPLPRGPESSAALREFLKRHRGEIAGVIVEPLVQAAGGMKFHDAATLRAVAAHCAAFELPLIADEIATGFGRTGTMFACERAGVSPDIVCVGKALTGGTMSLAATAASKRIVDAFRSDDPDKALMHGPTYMANPLACAAANASLSLFETEPRLDRVAAIEARLARALEPCRDLPGVVDVRVLGAIGVVQVEHLRDNDRLKRRFVEQGAWLRPFGDVVYTMPPFVISDDELAVLTDAMVTVLSERSAEPL